MDKITHEMRLAQWTNIIHSCAASGLSKRAWCQQNSIDEKQFYYWQRRIRSQVFEFQKCSEATALATTTATFVEVPTNLSSFQKNSPSNQVAATVCVNGFTIEISESASETFLKSLFGAIAYVK